MIGVSETDRADAMQFGAANSLFHREGGEDLTHRVAAVDDGKRPEVGDEFRPRHCAANARSDARGVPGKPHHAVRLMPPQISLHQRICRNRSIRFGHADRDIDGGCEIPERIDLNPTRGHRDITHVRDGDERAEYPFDRCAQIARVTSRCVQPGQFGQHAVAGAYGEVRQEPKT
jgi:hypothetical protein